jgi:LEA14-like dessication related protein
MKLILALVWCTMACLTGGCQQIGMASPDVALSDIRLTKVTPFETSAEVDLRVTNPNRIPLLIAGSVHQLTIDGAKIGSATSNDPFRVDALDSNVLTCELNMSNLSAVTKLRSILEQRRFDYAIGSTIHLVDGLFPLTLTSQGAFDAGQ